MLYVTREIEATTHILKLFLDSFPDGLVILDDQENIVAANDVIAHLFAQEKQDILGKPFANFISSTDFAHIVGITQTYKKMTDGAIRVSLASPQKQELLTSINGRTIVDPQSNCSFLLLCIHDISSEQKEQTELSRAAAEERSLHLALVQSEEYLDHIIESIPDCFLFLDPSDVVIRVNNVLSDLLGYEQHAMLGKNLQKFLSSSDLLSTQDIHSSLESQTRIENMSILLETKTLEDIQVSMSGMLMRDDKGAHTGTIMILRDMREFLRLLSAESRAAAAEKELQEELERAHQELSEALGQLTKANHQLEEQSYRDPLTQLHNRRFLFKSLEAEIQKIRLYFDTDHPARLVFLMIDLDHFKQINDIHGHAAGDTVLKEIALRMKRISGDKDLAIRWGGEEFLIVREITDLRQAVDLANTVSEVIRTEPIPIDTNRSLDLTGSLGLAIYPFHESSPESLDWEDVLSVADAALYAAKKSGRNQWVSLHATPTTPIENLKGLLAQGVRNLVAENMLAVQAQAGTDLAALIWE